MISIALEARVRELEEERKDFEGRYYNMLRVKEDKILELLKENNEMRIVISKFSPDMQSSIEERMLLQDQISNLQIQLEGEIKKRIADEKQRQLEIEAQLVKGHFEWTDTVDEYTEMREFLMTTNNVEALDIALDFSWMRSHNKEIQEISELVGEKKNIKKLVFDL